MSIAAQLKQYADSSVQYQLSKYPALNNIEKQTSVPKVYGVLGLASLYFFLIVFNLGGQLLTNLAGFVIPAYYSMNALFTVNKADDTQWLTVCLLSTLRVVLNYWYTDRICTSSTGSSLRCSRKRIPLRLSRLCDHQYLRRANMICSVIESLISVVYWFPFYFTFKFIFLLWLSLPMFRCVQPHSKRSAYHSRQPG